LIDMVDEPYEIQEEYYWQVPNILLTDRYINNLFTRSEKYYIYKILMSEDNKLTQRDLSEACGISRPTMIQRISELREVLNDWRI